MRLFDYFSGLAVRRQFCLLAAVALAVGGASSVKADVVAFDDFDGLETTLLQFTVATSTTGETGYFGWNAMDVDSWFAQQGDQGRDTCGCLGTTTNNTAMVADPDAWDDTTAGAPSDGYNSFASRTYDLTGHDETTVVITMDYEFRAEDSQTGTIEVSFDGGTTWQNLETFTTASVGGGAYADSNGGSGGEGQGTYTAGVEFSATSSTMILRFGMITSGNDWWFAFDNIGVTTTDGFSEMEDFEGLTLKPFVVSGGGDGTDWTEVVPGWDIDNSLMNNGVLGDGLFTDWTTDIPEWTVDNSGNLGQSLERAFDGWTAMDVGSWIAEQGGQGRTLFSPPETNTVLVADGDAFEDYDVDLDGNPWSDPDNPKPDEQVNTYISRTYDLSGFDNCTLVIDFLYEFRIENQQLGVAEVSFDGGTTWQRIMELDNNDGANNDTLSGLAEFTVADFQARQSNTMILRFGYLLAGNNWWFAIDEVRVQADPLTFVKGDANNNGVTDNLDLVPFTMAILDRPTYESTYGVNADIILDFNCDGTFNNLDIAGFVNVFLGN